MLLQWKCIYDVWMSAYNLEQDFERFPLVSHATMGSWWGDMQIVELFDVAVTTDVPWSSVVNRGKSSVEMFLILICFSCPWEKSQVTLLILDIGLDWKTTNLVMSLWGWKKLDWYSKGECIHHKEDVSETEINALRVLDPEFTLWQGKVSSTCRDYVSLGVQFKDFLGFRCEGKTK